MAEVGRLAMGCARPVNVSDTHLLDDAFALVADPESDSAGAEGTVGFHITTLLPTTPKIMLNVIADDYGRIERRNCGCLFEECGYEFHLSNIQSVNKLTGEGVTLVGSEMLKILEQGLPARFGGSPLDYQLQEEEDAQGFTRLALVISPRVTLSNEPEVIDFVVKSLRSSSLSADLAQSAWQSARALYVKRAEPVWTARGKLQPLHVVKASARAKREPG
jgi:hypothetical protein